MLQVLLWKFSSVKAVYLLRDIHLDPCGVVDGDLSVAVRISGGVLPVGEGRQLGKRLLHGGHVADIDHTVDLSVALSAERLEGEVFLVVLAVFLRLAALIAPNGDIGF